MVWLPWYKGKMVIFLWENDDFQEIDCFVKQRFWNSFFVRFWHHFCIIFVIFGFSFSSPFLVSILLRFWTLLGGAKIEGWPLFGARKRFKAWVENWDPPVLRESGGNLHVKNGVGLLLIDFWSFLDRFLVYFGRFVDRFLVDFCTRINDRWEDRWAMAGWWGRATR